METPSTENEEELSEYFRQYEDPSGLNGSNVPADAPAEGSRKFEF